MNDQSELLTIEQAALFLNVSETSLRRWTNDGRLACVRIGAKNVRRFRKSDLLAFLKLQPVRPDNPYTPHGHTTTVAGIKLLHGTHLCSIYSHHQARTQQSIDFLADGLGEDCACYLITTPEASQEMLNKLKIIRPNYQKDIDAGHLQISEFMESGPTQIKKLELSLKSSVARGAKCVRLVGNISESPLALNNSFEHVIQYEKDYQRLITKRFPVVTLCQYNAHSHSGLELVEALKCHHDNFSYPADRILD